MTANLCMAHHVGPILMAAPALLYMLYWSRLKKLTCGRLTAMFVRYEYAKELSYCRVRGEFVGGYRDASQEPCSVVSES